VAYYYFIGNWTIILWIFYFIPSLIVFIIILFYIADAPMFLITNLTPENALAEFTRIGKINGISVSITIN
jgi:TM2 domain-containing membrane protein YozV